MVSNPHSDPQMCVSNKAFFTLSEHCFFDAVRQNFVELNKAVFKVFGNVSGIRNLLRRVNELGLSASRKKMSK